MPAIATIALGSNLNQPIVQVRMAMLRFALLPKTRLRRVSSLYQSAPLGPQDQPNFINAVVAIETALTPIALLDACQAIEQAQGRVKSRRWGERTIDCDILTYGDQVISTDRLTIPHPEMHKRDFVMLPYDEVR